MAMTAKGVINETAIRKIVPGRAWRASPILPQNVVNHSRSNIRDTKLVGETQPCTAESDPVCMWGQKAQRPASINSAGVIVSEAANTKIRLDDIAMPAS